MRKFLSLSFIVFLLSASLLSKTVRQVLASDCSKTSVGFLSLNSLGAGLYKGKQGGLYPGGSNVRPAAHAGAGFQLAHSVTALDANGQPNANGRIVLISVGMSNTTQEFSTFKPMADADAVKNPRLVIVDGAQGGMSADRISDLNTASAQQYWQTVDQRLSAAGVTPAQVQVAWVKEADPGPTLDFPNDALRTPEQAGFDSFLKSGYASFREITNTATTSALIEAHKSDSFDHSGVQADRNLAFPLDRFRELVARGAIGSLNHRHFSFMGSILRPKRLIEETAPQVAERLRADGVDVVFLTPV